MCVNNDFTVLVSGGSRHHRVSMCTVWVAFKMTEWVELWSCITFCVKLKHSSMETIRMTQKAAAMGNWWLAASSQQHACSHITSHAVFCETPNHSHDSAPLQPRFGALRLLAFPKLKSPLKGKRFQTLMRFRKIRWGNWWQLIKLCEVLRYLLWREMRHHCPMYNVSCIFFNNYSIFILHGGYILDRP